MALRKNRKVKMNKVPSPENAYKEADGFSHKSKKKKTQGRIDQPLLVLKKDVGEVCAKPQKHRNSFFQAESIPSELPIISQKKSKKQKNKMKLNRIKINLQSPKRS